MEQIILPLLFELGEMCFYVNPVVLKDGDDLILVDTGYPGFLPMIENAFREQGLDIHKLKQVILTHHDHDHMGAVKALVTKYPSITVKCSKEQLPYMTGQKKSLRLEQAERTGADKGFLEMLNSVEYLDHAVVVEDQETICDGVRIIETPGHMPGHISVYVEQTKTLITGDLLVVNDNKLEIADPFFVLDKEEEIKSLRKIQSLEMERVICYHGGEYISGHLKEELNEIIKKGYKEEVNKV